MEAYSISENELRIGITLCIENVKRLTDAALALLNPYGNNQISLGLYTLAIEEFGKSLILKTCLENSNYDIPIDIFKGRDAHRKKYEKAQKQLPQKCWECYAEYLDVKSSSDDYEKAKQKATHLDNSVVDIRLISATLMKNITEKIIAEPNTRFVMFYVDWDNNLKSWKNKPVSKIAVEESISAFLNEIQKFRF